MTTFDKVLAEEELVRAVEQAGIVVGITDDGDVTNQLLWQAINQLAKQSRSCVGQYLTLNRKLHKAETVRRMAEDQRDRALRRLEELKATSIAQDIDLARERMKVRSLQGKLKRSRRR